MESLRIGVSACLLGQPVPDMVSRARDLAARALAVSVSASSGGAKGRVTAALRRLRDTLPRRCALLVGGDGGPTAAPGLLVFRDLAGLDAWARGLPGQ